MTDMRQTLACLLLAGGTLTGGIGMTGCSGNQSPGETISGWFGDMSPPTPSEAARDAFNLYDADKRRRAVTLLSNASWGGEAPYLKTYRLLVDDPDPTVRGAAVAALGRHGTVNDVPTLTRLLVKDDSKVVRWEAGKALQRLHSDEAILPLTQAMGNDNEVDVRIACANALGQYADRRSFDALVAALNDESYAVTVEAAGALHTLTGRDFGQDGGKWWYWAKDTQNLFADQQTYYYPQYDGPTSTWNRLAFWAPDKKEVTPEQPRVTVDAPATITHTTVTPTPSAPPLERAGSPAPTPASTAPVNETSVPPPPPPATIPVPTPTPVQPPAEKPAESAKPLEQPAPAQPPATAEQPAPAQSSAAAEKPAEPQPPAPATATEQPAQPPEAPEAAEAPEAVNPPEAAQPPANPDAPHLPPPPQPKPPYQHRLGAGG
ncbi:MAG: HEAT repeat domain-containing protein [Phycisphaeraceae bacterium]